MILTLLFMSDFWFDILYLKNAKHLKEELNKELMQVGWHPNKWWGCSVLEDKKKESNRFNFYWRVIKAWVSSIQIGCIETFCLLSYWNILGEIYKDSQP